MTRLTQDELDKLLRDNPDVSLAGEGRATVPPPPPEEKIYVVENHEFPRRKHKYGAQRTQVGNLIFDSKREAMHYAKLLEMQKEGLIRDLKLQPEFVLQEKFTDKTGKHHRAIVYIADFQFVEVSTGLTIVVDTKGMATPVFKLKLKLLLYRYPDLDFQVWK